MLAIRKSFDKIRFCMYKKYIKEKCDVIFNDLLKGDLKK